LAIGAKGRPIKPPHFLDECALPRRKDAFVHQPAFAAQRFLVVEDEPLIAIDLQRLLEQEGATVFKASSVTRARRLVETSSHSAGVIDIGLGDDNAGLICGELERRRVPFIFYTGQPTRRRTNGDPYPFVGKPTLPSVIIGAIKFAISADKAERADLMPWVSVWPP